MNTIMNIFWTRTLLDFPIRIHFFYFSNFKLIVFIDCESIHVSSGMFFRMRHLFDIIIMACIILYKKKQFSLTLHDLLIFISVFLQIEIIYTPTVYLVIVCKNTSSDFANKIDFFDAASCWNLNQYWAKTMDLVKPLESKKLIMKVIISLLLQVLAQWIWTDHIRENIRRSSIDVIFLMNVINDKFISSLSLS